MPGPIGVPRAAIVELLQEGHSDRYIGQVLRANPKRAGRIRAELGLPKSERKQGLTLEQKWRTRAQPATGGHMRWTGAIRSGMPNLAHRQRNHSARRVAFRIANDRDPVGRVLPGCGQSWCISPEHATDEPMRRSDALYTQIFRSTS
jgi:hypothetical protein